MKELDKVLSFFKENVSMNIIGANSEKEYGWVLKQIYEQAKTNNINIYTNEFKFPSNIQVITAIQNGLPSMNLYNLANEDIVLSQNVLLNRKIKQALPKYLQASLSNLPSRQAQENFFVKHIVWLYERLDEHGFKTDAKLIYFGSLDADSLIHINILNAIGYKTMFISPIKGQFIPGCENSVTFEKTLNNFNFMELIARAEQPAQNVIETNAKKASEEISEMLFDNKCLFKPWQYRNSTTKHLHLNAIVEDIWTYWNQDARFREGFKVENNIVHIPSFAVEIHGIYDDEKKMYDFINLLTKSDLTMVFTSTYLFEECFTEAEMYALAFSVNQNGLSFAKLKENKLYKLHSSSMDVQMFIFNKLNEYFLENRQKINQINMLRLIADVITMPLQYLQLIEGFDFPFRIPKIVLYIKNREMISETNYLFLEFLNYLGFDILILSPGGTEVCHQFRDILLDSFKPDYGIEQIKKPEVKKESFFKRMFGK